MLRLGRNTGQNTTLDPSARAPMYVQIHPWKSFGMHSIHGIFWSSLVLRLIVPRYIPSHAFKYTQSCAKKDTYVRSHTNERVCIKFQPLTYKPVANQDDCPVIKERKYRHAEFRSSLMRNYLKICPFIYRNGDRRKFVDLVIPHHRDRWKRRGASAYS